MSEKDDFDPADLPEDENEKSEQKHKGLAANVFSEIAAANNLNMDSTQYIGYSLAKVVVSASEAASFAEFQSKIKPYLPMAKTFIAATDAVSNSGKTGAV